MRPMAMPIFRLQEMRVTRKSAKGGLADPPPFELSMVRLFGDWATDGGRRLLLGAVLSLAQAA